jgi:uncharacterized protein (TIRG00374 family)
MRKLFRLFLQLVLGVVLIYLWLGYIDLGVVLGHLSQIELGYILLMFLIGMVGIFLNFLRLKIVISPLVKVPLGPLYSIGLASNLINFLLALRAGELAKSYYLKKLYGSSFVKAVSAVVVDRLADLLVTVFAVLVVGFYLGTDLLSPVALVLAFFIPLALIYLLAWRGEGLFNFAERTALKINLPWKERALPFLENLIKGFTVAKRDPKTLLAIFLLTAATLVLHTIGVSWMLMAFGVRAPFLGVLLAQSILVISFLLPSPPAYIGTVEVVGSLVFVVVLGIEKDLAASIALFFHVYSALVVGILGLPALGYLHLKLLKDEGR